MKTKRTKIKLQNRITGLTLTIAGLTYGDVLAAWVKGWDVI